MRYKAEQLIRWIASAGRHVNRSYGTQNAAISGSSSRVDQWVATLSALNYFGRFTHFCATAQGAACFQYLYREHCLNLKQCDRILGVGGRFPRLIRHCNVKRIKEPEGYTLVFGRSVQEIYVKYFVNLSYKKKESQNAYLDPMKNVTSLRYKIRGHACRGW